jgi:hypothetical protein
MNHQSGFTSALPLTSLGILSARIFSPHTYYSLFTVFQPEHIVRRNGAVKSFER